MGFQLFCESRGKMCTQIIEFPENTVWHFQTEVFCLLLPGACPSVAMTWGHWPLENLEIKNAFLLGKSVVNETIEFPFLVLDVSVDRIWYTLDKYCRKLLLSGWNEWQFLCINVLLQFASSSNTGLMLSVWLSRWFSPAFKIFRNLDRPEWVMVYWPFLHCNGQIELPFL